MLKCFPAANDPRYWQSRQRARSKQTFKKKPKQTFKNKVKTNIQKRPKQTFQTKLEIDPFFLIFIVTGFFSWL